MSISDNRLAELGLTLFVGVLAIFVAWNFVTPLLFAAILAYFSYPAYLRLKKKFGVNSSGMLICAFFAALLLVILNYGVAFMRNEVWKIYLGIASTSSSLGSNMQEIISFIATNIITGLSNLVSKIPSLFIASFIFFISLFYFLRDGERFTNWLEATLPIPRRKKMQIINHIRQNVDAFVHVTLLIGIIQAIIAGVGFVIFGLEYPFLAGAMAGLLSLLPIVGPYFLYGPVGAYLIFSGNTTAGIGILAYGFVLGSVLDYAARPLLLGRKANIHPLIIFIGVFGGLSMLGLIGVIIGPIILSIASAFFKDLGRRI
jgi:predicted PurR-regulated permease PerM